MATPERQPNIFDAFKNYPADLILYRGEINRFGYHRFCDLIGGSRKKKDRLCLALITYGGDPDAAYRIARAAKHHYHRMEVFIPDVCKSAGTLLCIGADELIFGDRGEMGPLDIQVLKPDELNESMSGLNIMQAVNALTESTWATFVQYLDRLRSFSGKIRTKTAAEIAASLASQLTSPIAAQIDPVTWGEHQRAMLIAFGYGNRLAEAKGSLKDNALSQLITGYPSHTFVIDRREARTLFNNVKRPEGEQVELDRIIRTHFCLPGTYDRRPLIFDLKKLDPIGEGHGDYTEPNTQPGDADPGQNA